MLKHAKATKIQALFRGYKCRCGIINLVEQLAVEEQNKEIAAQKQGRTQHLRAAKVLKSYKRFIAVLRQITRPSIRQSQVWRIANKHSSPEAFIEAMPQRSKTTSPEPSSTPVHPVDSYTVKITEKQQAEAPRTPSIVNDCDVEIQQ